jgi:hypothetical protein
MFAAGKITTHEKRVGHHIDTTAENIALIDSNWPNSIASCRIIDEIGDSQRCEISTAP